MNSKIFLLISAIFLVLLVMVSCVSAIQGRIGNARIVVREDIGETVERYIRVENGNDFSVNITLTAFGDLEENINIIDNEFTLAPEEEKNAYFTIYIEEEGIKEGSIYVEFIPPAGNGIGLISTIIVLAGAEETPESFCNFGAVGDSLVLSDIDISNDNGDDDEWSPLDEIEVEVEVGNEGDEEINDVIVELGLFNSENENIVEELEFYNIDEEEIDVGRIEDSDEENVEFSFRIPVDFEPGDYKLVVKAYSEDLGEDEMCVDFSNDFDNYNYQSIDGEREQEEEKHIVIYDIELYPETAQCGERVQVVAKMANIGDEDYEDRATAVMEVPGLGIYLEYTVYEDFDIGDSANIEFEFDVPIEAFEGNYLLEFRTLYDYNIVHGFYNIISDEAFLEDLRVQGNCEISSEIEEYLILEDIGDYEYVDVDIETESEEEIIRHYYSVYDKDDGHVYFAHVIRAVDEDAVKELLKDLEDFEIDLEVIGNNNVYIINEEYYQFVIWFKDNLIIFIEDHYYPLVIDPEIPSELVNAYLQKYPSEIRDYFCESGEAGEDLEIKVDINNKNGDDEEWTVFDDIEIEVEVENTGDVDIDDVIVEIGLLDEDDDNVINDLDFESGDEEVDLGKIKDNDEDTAVFEFKVPADFESGDYKLIVKAYSDGLGEENLCVESSDDLSDEYFEQIEIQREEDEGKFIVFDNIDIDPEKADCGESISVTLDVYNIGDKDQEKVRINLINDDLDLDLSEVISNFDEGEDTEVSFEFTLPRDLETKTYTLELSADYEYDDGSYEESSDDEETISLKVSNCGLDGSESGDDRVLEFEDEGTAMDDKSIKRDLEEKTIILGPERLDEEDTGFSLKRISQSYLLLLVLVIMIIVIAIVIVVILSQSQRVRYNP